MLKQISWEQEHTFKIGRSKSLVHKSGCIIWKGNMQAFNNNMNYATCKGMNAHIVSYIHYYGPFDDKLVVRHKCSNKYCINPMHLQLGTQTQNAQDQFWQEESVKIMPVKKIKLIKACIKSLEASDDPSINNFYSIIDSVSILCQISKQMVKNILMEQTYSYVKV